MPDNVRTEEHKVSGEGLVARVKATSGASS